MNWGNYRIFGEPLKGGRVRLTVMKNGVFGRPTTQTFEDSRGCGGLENMLGSIGIPEQTPKQYEIHPSSRHNIVPYTGNW